jgi:predicted dehydrogenase
MKTIRFGIVGCGMMGREFASAAARWMHLTDVPARPEITAICNTSEGPFAWYREACPKLELVTKDFRELLASKKVDAVYVAVPHHLHQKIYCAAIESGKHLMGEKPFGIDKAANDAIVATIQKVPEVFVRCSSEFPFFPAMQRIGELIESNAFGKIIEISTGFLHSSDLDASKPINWKRQVEFCGEYGVMGDLGMHACHVPFRAGWVPKNVRAVLGKVVNERPDGKGGMVPCTTWDNATLLCDTRDTRNGDSFPWTIRTHRIAPGNRNSWYIEILATRMSARWSSINPKMLETLHYQGGEQSWLQIQTGYDPAFKTITGGIFEFGFTDSILQMWAAFVHELASGKPLKKFAGCVTADETAISHRLFTAALKSYAGASVVEM